MNNTEWLKQLKVGDKVCVNNEKIGHVVKITKTMVVLGSGRRFNIKSGWQTGNNLYGSSYIEPLTDEKIIELKKKHIRIFIINYDYDKLTDDQKNQVYKLLKSFANDQTTKTKHETHN